MPGLSCLRAHRPLSTSGDATSAALPMSGVRSTGYTSSWLTGRVTCTTGTSSSPGGSCSGVRAASAARHAFKGLLHLIDVDNSSTASAGTSRRSAIRWIVANSLKPTRSRYGSVPVPMAPLRCCRRSLPRRGRLRSSARSFAVGLRDARTVRELSHESGRLRPVARRRGGNLVKGGELAVAPALERLKPGPQVPPRPHPKPPAASYRALCAHPRR